MSAMEADTLDNGDCLEWRQRWEDQCVEPLVPEGQPWALGTQRQQDHR